MVKKLQMYFQVSSYKRRNFLYINDNNSNSICPTYSKGGAWLKHFSLSNLLCTCITRLITNYTSIIKYKQRFFPNSSITYLCGSSLIETRLHILYDYKQYKKSWNSKQESLKDVLTFLKFNPGIFCFQEGSI